MKIAGKKEGNSLVKLGNTFSGFIRPSCIRVMIPMQKCKDIRRSGKARLVLLLPCLLLCISLNSNALSLVEMANNPEKAVDTETGDIYVWDYEKNEWVKEEIVSRETDVPSDSNNDELLLQPDSVQALESKVTGLEQDVESLALEVSALSAVVSDYSLGTTNLAIFEGLVEKVPFGQHYVYWRDSEYRYCFAVGHLTVSGTDFSSADPVTVYSYERIYSSGNSYYSWSVSTDGSFSLACGSRLVYSDIGGYPAISGREVKKYDAVTAYCAVGVVLFALFDRLRRSCFRRG